MQKWSNLAWLALAELLAMTLWFSASAVVPQLTEEWHLSDAQKSWMTMSVQIGFVCGALASAVFNLADRVPTRLLFSISALCGAGVTACIPWLEPSVPMVLVLRFATGVFLAGVYPPGMKLMATWCKTDRGLGIGILVGALTLGSAMPHLLNALPIFGEEGMPPWRNVLAATSAFAVVASVIAGLFVSEGPHLSKAASFDWRMATRALADKPTRLANFGYLGHMWELYAMWASVPALLIASYGQAELSIQSARLAGFAVIGIGAVGCVVAGLFADRIGRTTVAITSLVVSGSCALVAGLCFEHPILLTAVCLVWGFAVVADSAQFSAAISELADARYVGTALTVQTSLGFLLTMLTIYLVPALKDALGWKWVLSILAIGPVFGIWSMWRLRALPEATKMASGNR